MTNQQVADSFARGESSGRSGNMFIESCLSDSTVVYSYGHHWPIAIRTSESFAWVNSSKYSVTTSCHAGRVIRALLAQGYELEHKDNQTMIHLVNFGEL